MRLIKSLGVASILLAAATTMGSCADSEAILFVRGVLIPSAQDCTVSADPSAALFLGGVLDVELTTSYQAALLVGNQLTQRGSRNELRAETNRVALRGAEVQILTSTDELIKEFTVPASGFVDQATAQDPSYGSLYATLIDNATGETLRGVLASGGTVTVVINVKVFGTTLGGKDVESASLTYPITVCRGCLIAYPAEQAQARCDPSLILDDTDQEDCSICTRSYYGQDFAVCCADCFTRSALCRL